MNTTKNTTKKSTKKVSVNKKATEKIEFTPKYVIDITTCSTIDDILITFAIYKILYFEDINSVQAEALLSYVRSTLEDVADVALNKNEIIVYDELANRMRITRTFRTVRNSGETAVISDNGITIKKPGIFKRFWNWITRKK